MTAPLAAGRSPATRVVGLVLAGFIGGLAVAGALGHRTSPASGRAVRPLPASKATEPASSGPVTRADGIPSGFDRSREGAVAAAAGYVSTGQALIRMDPFAAAGAVRSMAATATAEAQVADTLARLVALRRALAAGSGPVTYRQAVLAWRVDGFSPDRARVAVWNVGVLSREAVAPPQAGWATSTFELVWERDDWRIWAETISPGPAPLLDDSAAPATSAQLDAALEGFTPVEVGP